MKKVLFNRKSDMTQASIDGECKTKEELEQYIKYCNNKEEPCCKLNNLSIERVMDKGKEFGGKETEQNLSEEEKIKKKKMNIRHIEIIKGRVLMKKSKNNNKNYNSLSNNNKKLKDVSNNLNELLYIDPIFNDPIFLRFNGPKKVESIRRNQQENIKKYKCKCTRCYI